MLDQHVLLEETAAVTRAHQCLIISLFDASKIYMPLRSIFNSRCLVTSCTLTRVLLNLK